MKRARDNDAHGTTLIPFDVELPSPDDLSAPGTPEIRAVWRWAGPQVVETPSSQSLADTLVVEDRPVEQPVETTPSESWPKKALMYGGAAVVSAVLGVALGLWWAQAPGEAGSIGFDRNGQFSVERGD